MQAATAKMIQVDVWRGVGSQGELVVYHVPQQPSQTVLDIVTWIQRHADASLSYRFACRVGMCGSCAMTVNGIPRWACRSHVDKVLVDGRLRIEPLSNLPVIKDLVCDMNDFFKKWRRAEGQFAGQATRNQAVATISPHDARRRAADAAIECINCAICYAACDVVAWEPEYLGPAALNRAWSLQNDQRDRRSAQRLQAVSAVGGCQHCHSQQGCATYCPNGLNPTASIAGLKRQAVNSLLGLKTRPRHA